MLNEEFGRGLLGLVAFIGLAWVFCENRAGFRLRTLLAGLAIQILLAIVLTRAPIALSFFKGVTHVVDSVQSAATAGASFMFGYLGGAPPPYVRGQSGSTFIFAFQALPAILMVGGLSALLWHWKILIWIVRGAAWLFGRAFQVSGPVAVSTSACIFLGMVEAPLLVRPLLPKLTRGELFIIMVDGLSVVAGSTMLLLGTMMAARIPDAFTHLLTGSIVTTPMAIALAKAMVSSPPSPLQAMELSSPYRSSLEAMTFGTLDAVKMVINIAGLLIVFVSAIALVDKGLALIPHSGAPISLNLVFGKLLSPVAWLMGAPRKDLEQIGALLGLKVMANEVVAYSRLIDLPAGALSPKSELITTYALCSFGNLGSVAIMIGSLSTMVPEKVGEVVDLGFRALLAAFLATCLTGTIMGLLAAF